MDAEKNNVLSAKICGRKKVFPQITQLIVKKISAKICRREEYSRRSRRKPQKKAQKNQRKSAGEKSIPADHAHGRKKGIQMILKLYSGQILWGKLSFRFSNAKSILNIIRFCFSFF